MEITRCAKRDCILVHLGNHLSVMTKEDQVYFINWMKENKPELLG